LLRVVARGQPVERGRYVECALVLGDQEACVSEALGLFRNTPDHGGIGWTDAWHSNPRRKVDDVIAVDIDQDAASGSLDEDRHRDAQTARKFGSAPHLQLLRLGTWDAGREDATLLRLRHVIPPSGGLSPR